MLRVRAKESGSKVLYVLCNGPKQGVLERITRISRTSHLTINIASLMADLGKGMYSSRYLSSTICCVSEPISTSRPSFSKRRLKHE